MTRAPLKILIADSNPNIVQAVAEYFGRVGMDVLSAESGEEALTVIRNVKPDVLLIEYLLPGMDGLELCQLLQKNEWTAHIPIIFLTAKDDVVDKVLGLESGASDYITKPFSLRELEARIKAVLRNLRVKRLVRPGGEADGEAREALFVWFDFPEEVHVPCEQYLLYFGQFLRDLGVEAATDLRHDAGQVLFSVTPANKDEALDKIREALMAYLGMSASPVNNLDTLDYEIAVQRLVAEVQTLQSRITLGRAELQLKNATIQQQQIAIDTLRTQGGSLMLESLSEVKPEPKDDDREEVIGGLVAVKKFEWKFLEVGVPEMFRRLKQLFGKKDE